MSESLKENSLADGTEQKLTAPKLSITRGRSNLKQVIDILLPYTLRGGGPKEFEWVISKGNKNEAYDLLQVDANPNARYYFPNVREGRDKVRYVMWRICEFVPYWSYGDHDWHDDCRVVLTK